MIKDTTGKEDELSEMLFNLIALCVWTDGAANQVVALAREEYFFKDPELGECYRCVCDSVMQGRKVDVNVLHSSVAKVYGKDTATSLYSALLEGVRPAAVTDVKSTVENIDGLYKSVMLKSVLSEGWFAVDKETPEEVIDKINRGIGGVVGGTDEEGSVSDYADKVMGIAMGSKGLSSKFLEANLILDYNGLIILAARPSDGKTTIALNEAEGWAMDTGNTIDSGDPGGIFSLEMNGEDLLMRLAASRIGIPFFKFLKGGATNSDREQLRKELEKMKKLPLYIKDGSYTIDKLCATIITETRRLGWKWVIIDYLQLVKMTGPELNRSRNDVVGNWSTRLKDVNKQVKIPIVAVSQLSRSNHRNKEETPPPPTLEALRDSGQIEQDADLVIFLYKKPGLDPSEFDNNDFWPMMMEVAKQRNGPLGIVEMMFDRKRSRYLTLSEYRELTSRTPTKEEAPSFF